MKAGTVPRLMLVTDRRLVAPGRLVEVVARAVDGGVDTVQVREKDLPDGPLEELLRAICRATQGRAQVVVNGRPELAFALGIGLHLPQDAGPGPQPGGLPLWGRSVHSPASARQAAAERPDYLVAGPVFATSSKPQARPLGTAGLRAIVEAAAGLPVLAIGGILPGRLAQVIRAGAAGVAVRGFILQAADPGAAAQQLARALACGQPLPA